MFTGYVVVTLLAAAANGYAATCDFLRTKATVTHATRVGVPFVAAIAAHARVGWYSTIPSPAAFLLLALGALAMRLAIS
jgi:hypothetical protein